LLSRISKDDEDQEEEDEEDNHDVRISISFRDIYPAGTTTVLQQSQGPMLEMNASKVLKEIALTTKGKHDIISPPDGKKASSTVQTHDYQSSTTTRADDATVESNL